MNRNICVYNLSLYYTSMAKLRMVPCPVKCFSIKNMQAMDNIPLNPLFIQQAEGTTGVDIGYVEVDIE